MCTETNNELLNILMCVLNYLLLYWVIKEIPVIINLVKVFEPTMIAAYFYLEFKSRG